MQQRTSVFTTIALSLATTLGATVVQADTPQAEVAFNIAAQPLEDALNQFAQQTGYQVLFQSSMVQKQTAPKIDAKMTPGAALQALLSNTSLQYKFVNPRTVAISTVEDTSSVAKLEKISLRLGQNTGNTGPENKGSEASPGDSDKSPSELQEVVIVTGSHIRGAGAPAVPLEVFDREDIERSGHTTTEAFIRTIPQNFKGGASGASEDGVLGGNGGLANLESASGVNLRGLGNGSTLVLLNGRRLASAAYGAAVDVSMIPLEAIDRIEVLTSGASSTYGSDAVGGVMNFILRDDYGGAQTTLNLGTTTQGGRDEYLVSQTVGGNWANGGVLAALQYRSADKLDSRERTISRNAAGPTDLYPSRDQYSLLLSARQGVSERLELFFEGLYTHQDQERNLDNAGLDQHQQGDIDFQSLGAGVRWDAFSDWQLEVSGLHSANHTRIESRYEPDRAGYTDGTLEILNRFNLVEGGLKANGSLFTIGSSTVRAALGGSRRKEEFSNFIPRVSRNHRFDRTVTSAFGEVAVPLISAANARTGARRLEFSASVRWDDYEDAQTSITNPQFGVLWSPVDALTLRASYGTSFRMPSFNDLSLNRNNQFAYALPGFALPGGGTGAALVLGAAPELDPEEARNYTLGFEIAPASLQGARFWAGYYRIVYDDRIVVPPFDASVLTKPDVYGPLFIPFSSDQEVQTFVSALQGQGYTVLPFVPLTGIRHALFIGNVNAARVRQSGVDFGFEYSWDVGGSRVDWRNSATYIDEITTAFCESCTETNLRDVYGQPTRLRLRSEAGLTRGELQANFALNYVNGYSDTSVSPAGRIGSWTTVDFNARYTPARLQGLSLGLNVINLFDADPPRTAGTGLLNGIFYDSANADPLGRIVTVRLQKQWK